MTKIRIKHGTYKMQGKEYNLAGFVFPLVEHYREGLAGGFVTVDANQVAGFPNRAIRVAVQDQDSYEVVDDNTAITNREETDEEIIDRLRVRFDMLDDMTRAVKRGDVRALIVSGPPGVGKSHGVEKVLDRYDLVETLGGPKKYEIVKGAMSAIGLYCKLYKYSSKDNVIVFDDCDSVFSDELSLNILKAALDSKKRRTIHWNTDSYKLRNEGVPDQFAFEGSAIFITNLKFDKSRGKIREHLEALQSRCHYMDLTIDTDREKMLRIRQIVMDGMLDEHNLGKDTEQEIVEYVNQNKARLRELSLRTVLKVADLARAFPDRWRSLAETTVMR